MLAGARSHELLLLLAGFLPAPLYALLPALGAQAVPLSVPNEEARAAGRALRTLGFMLPAVAVAGLALWADHGGWLGSFLIGEAAVVLVSYALVRVAVARAPWPSSE
jgi:hypothetical protein